jgi:hypothetical protein
MGTTLTGTTPQDTYDSLIKVTDNGPLSGTLKALSDGLGNDSALALSTGAASITGTLAVSGAVTTGTNTNVQATSTNTRLLVTAAGVANTILGFNNSGSTQNGVVNNAGYVGILQDYPLVVTIADGEKMRITGTGNVGIGTSSPDTLVTLGTTARTDNTAGIKIFRGGGTASYATYGFSGNAVINSVGGDLVFQRESTERARFTTEGLCFNGDFLAANALDDYEEGTWTPTIAGSTTAGTATYTTQLARYTKIGRQVSCQIDLGYNSGTGTGNLTIAGLPFTDAGLNNPAVTIGYLDGITLTANNYALAYLASGTTRIDFVQIPTGGGSLTSVSYDSEGRIILNVTYTA